MLYLRAMATGWVADEPQPGTVRLAIVDAEGATHQWVEKCSVIDPDHRLTPRADYPIAVGIACVPRYQELGSDPWLLHNEVELSPWGVGEPGATYVVAREQLICVPPLLHSDLSLAARQAVAVATFRRWRSAVGLDRPELDAVENHLCQFALVTSETFGRWERSEPWFLRRVRRGRRLPWGLASAAKAAGVDRDDLRHAIDALQGISCDGLYGGIDSAESLARLHDLGSITERNGVPLASADDYPGSLWIDDDMGRPSQDVIDGWPRHRQG